MISSSLRLYGTLPKTLVTNLGYSFLKVNTTSYESIAWRFPRRRTFGGSFVSSGCGNIRTARCFKSGIQQQTSKNYGDQNYFEILGCNISFDIDEKELERKFRAILSQWHPDLHGQSSSHLQEQAAAMSAAVNRAYGVLKKPHLRAKYLLEIKGVPLSEDDVTMEPSFLMHILELREKVEEESNKIQLQQIRETVAKETEEGNTKTAIL
ncbi:molecular chaperone HscB [Galdieria sulphuraria]|uniref:Molecular chaperone HscB n=1 Tax=Galdieria sulphuraria TaxID=130081 RepID=M2W2G4_GALSU|nr:molecular chaperone HscB [Galdieria sulphuraria]EME29871.1 molecular chaperone HscB [Galdieria sulphuraria]|eukprot:XP_005706391.1 molecular chaperone HscB [Galdieria sulphuraria]